jgi:hypothetical protein
MCAWVGNQWSRGVVTAWVRTDAVRSLRYQLVLDFVFLVRYTCVSFSLFPVFIPRSTEKAKKIFISSTVTLRAVNFISVTLLSLCPSWLSHVAG